VAPKCNIRCNYCSKNRSKPCACEKVIGVEEAVNVVLNLRDDRIKIVGVAGPGEPLYNNETFITLKTIDKKFSKCLCTNGLLLPEKVNVLRKIGVKYITVTINAVDARIGAKIYSYIRYGGELIKGERAAKILIENQLEGLRLASKSMIVKVNSVLIPGINDEHLTEVAEEIKDYAYIQNVIPLVPQYKFSNLHPPSPKLVERVRAKCERHIKQMRHCALCRADAVGRLCENKTIFHCMREFNSSNVKTLGRTK
jgi:nitrogen fixation protein NifB